MIKISLLQEVAKNLYLIRGEETARFPYCHTYLFDEDILIAFDPQCGKQRLNGALQELNKDITNLNFIINSHFHLDHTASDYYLKKKSGAQIWIHELDRSALENFDEYVKRYGMNDNLEEQWKQFLRNYGFREVVVDHAFQDGDILPGGFEVIHTPGHAPGHCSFYKSKILLAGDIDLVSPWLGNLTCSLIDYLNSLEKLEKLDIQAWFPAHGEPIYENIPERIDLFRQRFLKHADRIFNLLPATPFSLDQITELVFQSYPEDQKERIKNRQAQFRAHFGKISTLNYLNYLESIGKIKKSPHKAEPSWQRIE